MKWSNKTKGKDIPLEFYSFRFYNLPVTPLFIKVIGH